MLSGHADPRIVIRARGPNLIERMSSQELLGRKAADPVLAANKQQLLQLGHACIFASQQCSAPAGARVCA
jgi:hypothetical protein